MTKSVKVKEYVKKTAISLWHHVCCNQCLDQRRRNESKIQEENYNQISFLNRFLPVNSFTVSALA